VAPTSDAVGVPLLGEPLKIAVPLLAGSDSWPGGRNYSETVLRALRRVAQLEDLDVRRIDLSQLSDVTRDANESAIKSSEYWSSWPVARPSRIRSRRSLQGSREHAVYPNVSSVGLSGEVGWIPDVQAWVLSRFFSRRDVLSRTKSILVSLHRFEKVVVSSQAVRDQILERVPFAGRKVSVWHFPSTLVDDLISEGPDRLEWLSSLHTLSSRPIFYLPNQYWTHKNHVTVLRALAIARMSQPDILLICTGLQSDPRSPGHFERLAATVEELGLSSNVKLLGMVSRTAQAQLFREALAVIQPSLYEGWSTSIEESKLLRCRLIASDIPVHREQAPQALFFSPEDAAALAHALELTIAAPQRQGPLDASWLAFETQQLVGAGARLAAILKPSPS
jgi:glycosyltransferase involved in cell wall biosynthesis